MKVEFMKGIYGMPAKEVSAEEFKGLISDLYSEKYPAKNVTHSVMVRIANGEEFSYEPGTFWHAKITFANGESFRLEDHVGMTYSDHILLPECGPHAKITNIDVWVAA